jgi:hypothetical protein
MMVLKCTDGCDEVSSYIGLLTGRVKTQKLPVVAMINDVDILPPLHLLENAVK